MKKLLAVLAVLVLLISMLSFSVSAAGFVFKELSRTQTATQLEVTWNMHEFAQGDDIEDILIGGQSVPFTMAGELLLVDTSSVAPGYHSVVYEYVSGETQGSTQGQPLVIGGDVEVSLSAVINGDGTVTISAKTPQGEAVPHYGLRMTIGNMTGLTGETDANGRYTSFIMLDYGQSATFEGVGHTDGSINYLAAAQKSVTYVKPTTVVTTVPTTTAPTEDPAETTTTVEGETTTADGTETTTEVDGTETTTEQTVTTTTKPQTIVTVVGAGTTAVKGDKVMLNVSTDTGILNLFALTADRFADRARLYVSQDDYISLVGRNSSNMLMLNMLTSQSPAGASQIQQALQGAEQFEDCGDYTWVTFDLSFLLLDKGGNVRPVSAMPIDSTYIIELPIPESMKDCDEFAITVKDGEGLMTPAKVEISGGVFKMEINALDSYTLMGFVSQNGDKAGGTSLWVVLLFIVGALLLAGAATIFYLFVLRKPAKKNEEEAAVVVTAPQEDGNDIFSGRSDLPPTDGE